MAARSWVAFLRGMNLGGRRLTNDELVAAMERCGCDRVASYQASGNVVFDDDRSADELESDLPDGLAEALGYPVPVFVRTADEVRAIAEVSPVSTAPYADSRSKPQVVFLHTAPSAAVLEEVRALVPEDDALVAAGRELHWLPVTGVGASTLDFRRLDQLTGGTTIRTHATVQRLAKRFL